MPVALGQADDDRRYRSQQSHFPRGEPCAIAGTHERDHDGYTPGKVKGIADLFRQAGLNVVGPIVLTLVEPIGCNVAKTIQPRVYLTAASLEERIEQIRSLLIVIDEDRSIADGKSVKQANGFFTLVVGEDNEKIDLDKRPQGIHQRPWKALDANRINTLREERHPGLATPSDDPRLFRWRSHRDLSPAPQ